MHHAINDYQSDWTSSTSSGLRFTCNVIFLRESFNFASWGVVNTLRYMCSRDVCHMCPLDTKSVIQSLPLPRSVTLIDNECRQVNDKLRRLVAVLPDASSLAAVDYDTSKRADPEVLQTLVSHAKKLKVYHTQSRHM